MRISIRDLETENPGREHLLWQVFAVVAGEKVFELFGNAGEFLSPPLCTARAMIVSRGRARYRANRYNAVSWAVKALVEATPSRRSSVVTVIPSESRVIMRPEIRCRWRPSWNVWLWLRAGQQWYPAVSPDCEISMVSVSVSMIARDPVVRNHRPKGCGSNYSPCMIVKGNQVVTDGHKRTNGRRVAYGPYLWRSLKYLIIFARIERTIPAQGDSQGR